jgi:cytochrome c-type biogenesis protein CcmH/NrfG
MLAIDGEDAWALRLAAIQAMRLQQFEAALAYWRKFDAVSPGQDSTVRNINRCEILVRRMAGSPRSATKAG